MYRCLLTEVEIHHVPFLDERYVINDGSRCKHDGTKPCLEKNRVHDGAAPASRRGGHPGFRSHRSAPFDNFTELSLRVAPPPTFRGSLSCTRANGHTDRRFGYTSIRRQGTIHTRQPKWMSFYTAPEVHRGLQEDRAKIITREAIQLRGFVFGAPLRPHSPPLPPLCVRTLAGLFDTDGASGPSGAVPERTAWVTSVVCNHSARSWERDNNYST